MVDASVNSVGPLQPVDKAHVLNNSPLSTTVESNADGTSRRWSIDNRSTETPSRLSVTNHLLSYFNRRYSMTTSQSRAAPNQDDASTTAELREELKVVRKEYEELVTQLNETKMQMRLRENQLSRLENTNGYCQKLLERNSSLELTIGRIQDEYEARLQVYEAELAKTAEAAASGSPESGSLKYEQALADLEEAKKQNAAMVGQVQKLNSEIQRLSDANLRAKAESAASESGLNILQQEYERMRALYTKQLENFDSANLKEIMNENFALAKDKMSLMSLRDELKARNYELQTLLQKAKGESEIHQRKTAQQQQQIDHIYNQYQQLKASVMALTTSRKARGGVDMPAEALVLDLKQQIEEMEAEFEAREKKYKSRINELEVANIRMKEQLKNFDQVHQIATDMLKRNEDLEQSVPNITELAKSRKEIKCLEAQILILNKQLASHLSNAASSDEAAALAMLDKTFLENLKHEHQKELQRVHDDYKLAMERERERVKREQESKERTLRADFVSEFDGRLKEQEQILNQHYKKLIDNLEAQNKNRLIILKRELNTTREEYLRNMKRAEEEHDRILKALQSDCDDKLFNAANEMEELMKRKDDEIGQLRISLASLQAKNAVLLEDIEKYKKDIAAVEREMQAKIDEMTRKALADDDHHDGHDSDLPALLNNLKKQFEDDKQRLNKRIYETEVLLNDKMNENKDLQKLVTELETKMATRPNESTKTVQKLITRNKELEETIAGLSAKINDTLRERDAQTLHPRSTLQVVEVESGASKSIIDSLQRKVSELELAKSQLSANLAAFVNKSTPLNGEDRPPVSDFSKLEKLYTDVVTKLDEVSASIREGLDMDAESRDAVKALVDAHVERSKMNQEIELLQSARDSSSAKIRGLEQQLAEAQMATHASVASAKLDEIYEAMMKERKRLADLTSQMRRSVESRESLLESEHALRSNQLEFLEKSKAALRKLIEKNSELEKMVTDAGVVDATGAVNFERIEHLLSQLDSQNTGMKESHYLEVTRLRQMVDEHEADKTRVVNEKSRLETELKQSHEMKVALLKQEWENRHLQQTQETQRYKQMVDDLKRQMEKLQQENQLTKEESQETLQTLISSISTQLSQNELIMARVQDEKDSELDAARRALEVSIATQKDLSSEIERVEGDLMAKEAELRRNTDNLERLVRDMGLHPDDIGDIDCLREAFHNLEAALKRSDDQLTKLKTYLNELICRQHEEMDRTYQHLDNIVLDVPDSQRMSIDSTLLGLKSTLEKQQSKVSHQSSSISELRNKLKDLQDAKLTQLSKLNAKSLEESDKAYESCKKSGLAARAITSFVSRVQSIVQTVESRSTTCETVIDVPNTKRGIADVNSSPSVSGKRPRT